MKEPFAFTGDWGAVPGTLKVWHLSSIYGVAEETLRAALRRGDPSLPTPFADRPYRFRKSEVVAHYARLELSDMRRARARLRRQEQERVREAAG